MTFSNTGFEVSYLEYWEFSKSTELLSKINANFKYLHLTPISQNKFLLSYFLTFSSLSKAAILFMFTDKIILEIIL